jgi:hypothetical protein
MSIEFDPIVVSPLLCVPGISPGPHPDEPIHIPHPPPIIDNPHPPVNEPGRDIDEGPIGDRPKPRRPMPPPDPPPRRGPPPQFWL